MAAAVLATKDQGSLDWFIRNEIEHLRRLGGMRLGVGQIV